jgi:lipopolysaccharide transport system ATP-binding protein
MIAIEAKNIWKTYQIYKDPSDRLKEVFSFSRKSRHTSFHALKDVSFSIESGRSVGFVGENGSGKSTLLQIIAGVLTPSSGSMHAHGRIAALLELGAGFNPEFSGLENIKFQCSIMGIPSERQPEVIEQIQEFAEIGSFIHQPVKTYSSGMYVRIAFAAAINVDPDILIVDEALAVGDIKFQSKCLRKIREFRNQGKTLLFVSHDAGAIKTLCDQAYLLRKGELIFSGDPDKVVKYYNNMLAIKEFDETPLPNLHKRSGNGKMRIQKIMMLNEHGTPTNQFVVGERVSLIIDVEAFADLENPTVGMSFHDRLGNEMFGINNHNIGVSFGSFKRGDRRRITYSIDLRLGTNTYSISASCHPEDTHLIENYDWVNDEFVFRVNPSDERRFVGACFLDTSVTISDVPT